MHQRAARSSKPLGPMALRPSSISAEAGLWPSTPTGPSARFSSRSMESGISGGKPEDHMTDRELEQFLTGQGHPEHIARAGRAGLVACWKQFVGEVEKGYRFGLEDYRNDLDLRAVIAKAGLDDEVKEEDARFKRLLTAIDRRVWESSPPDAFWNFGYPKNPKDDLLEDLRAEGLA